MHFAHRFVTPWTNFSSSPSLCGHWFPRGGFGGAVGVQPARRRRVAIRLGQGLARGDISSGLMVDLGFVAL